MKSSHYIHSIDKAVTILKEASHQSDFVSVQMTKRNIALTDFVSSIA